MFVTHGDGWSVTDIADGSCYPIYTVWRQGLVVGACGGGDTAEGLLGVSEQVVAMMTTSSVGECQARLKQLWQIFEDGHTKSVGLLYVVSAVLPPHRGAVVPLAGRPMFFEVSLRLNRKDKTLPEVVGVRRLRKPRA